MNVAALLERKRPKGEDRGREASVRFNADTDGKMMECDSEYRKGERVPVADSVRSLKKYEKAFEIVQCGHLKGEVVLRVGGKRKCEEALGQSQFRRHDDFCDTLAVMLIVKCDTFSRKFEESERS